MSDAGCMNYCVRNDLIKECDELVTKLDTVINAVDRIDDIVRHHGLDSHAFGNDTLRTAIDDALRGCR